jgi:hypothetical protein
VLSSRGIWLSCAGAALVALSMASLLVIPGAIAGAGMLVGAIAVIAGFVWTMTEYYLSPPSNREDQ